MKKIIMCIVLLSTMAFGMEVNEVEFKKRHNAESEISLKKHYAVKATGVSMWGGSDTVNSYFVADVVGTWVYVEDTLATDAFKIKIKYKNKQGKFVEKESHKRTDVKIGYFIELPSDYEKGRIEILKYSKYSESPVRIFEVTPPDDFSHVALKKYVDKY